MGNSQQEGVRCHLSGPHQGREAHVERYRNSPVMHPSVPEPYKPIILQGGERIPFPAPTKMPKAPRNRKLQRSGYGETGVALSQP